MCKRALGRALVRDKGKKEQEQAESTFKPTAGRTPVKGDGKEGRLRRKSFQLQGSSGKVLARDGEALVKGCL